MQTAFGRAHCQTIGDGPWLTLLHQAAQSAEEFALFAPLLASDFTILTIDMPGHGMSDDPPHELSADEFIAATLQVLDAKGIAHSPFVGHHSGAAIAAGIAAEFPDRVSELVLSGLVLPSEAWLKAFVETPMTRDLPTDADGKFLEASWQVYRDMSAPDVPAEITSRALLAGLKARLRPYDAHYAILRWDLASVLKKINAPVLGLDGEYDSFVGDRDALAALMPRSKRVVVPNGGAFMYYEQPVACAAAIRDFVAATPDAG